MIIKPTKVKDNPLPVSAESFWKQRIYQTIAQGGMLHQIIYNNSYDVWYYLQEKTGGKLGKIVRENSKVLDAGCGYGALIDSFDLIHQKIDYTGVDISPDLIELAKYRYPGEGRSGGRFYVGDLKSLEFSDKEFDWGICRGVEGMIIENIGPEEWQKILSEIKRVSKKVILLSYPTTLEEDVIMEVL